MAHIQLTDLPDEVIQTVLYQLTYTGALALEATCRRFRDVSNEPLLWKRYCQQSFKKWRSGDVKARSASKDFTGWKLLFEERMRTNKNIRNLMNGVIDIGTDRIRRLENITRLGYDAKEALIEGFKNAHLHTGDVLARRYWNYISLGCVHRALAVEEWHQLQPEDPCERSLGALDLFVLTPSRPGDIEEIFEKLDSYVANVRQDHPELDQHSPRQIASVVARHLLSKGWTGIDEGRDYHNIEHNFLGVALYSDRNNSLPLISAVIYCYVLRKLGLQASPCGFPMHVHALIRAPPEIDLDGNPRDTDMKEPVMYMDPFRSDQEVSISSLNEQLRMISYRFTQRELDGFLNESNARDITIRCARNILNPQRSRQPPLEDVDKDAATYAGAWALALFHADPAQHSQALRLVWQEFNEKFMYDVGLIQNHILPMMSDMPEFNQYQKACRQLRRFDENKRHPHLRSDKKNALVKYKMGQVFRHKRYDYLAAITGWDHECRSGEAWIQQMGVDRLPNGREQPFYHVFALDGSTRYVAEENIEILTTLEEHVANSFAIEIGRYFLRWDDANKVFVSNMKDEFPED